MSNQMSKTRKTNPINANEPPRVTSHAKLNQMKMWAKELMSMGFKTREIGKWYSGSASNGGRISHMASGAHMGEGAQIRPTEKEFDGLRMTYFIAKDMTDKTEVLDEAALNFFGSMAATQELASELITITKSLHPKRKVSK